MSFTSTNVRVACGYCGRSDCGLAARGYCGFERLDNNNALVFNADDLNAAYANAQLMPAHQYKLWKWVTYITLITLAISTILIWYMVIVSTLPISAGLFITAGMCLIAYEVYQSHRNC